MQRIKILSSNLINQIAAGEVIERPASVIKELVENSIDAEATRIDVIIKDGGRTFIQVSDNGIGMSSEDLEISFQRHATSKINSQDDLASVSSLGFRGEAMPSIASVARVYAKSSTNGNEGTELSIDAGIINYIRPIGCVKGTLIQVKNIFFNIPARRKFLKKADTEQRAITSIFRRYILSYPDISFKLIVNDKIVYQLASGDLLQRIEEVYGKSFAKSVLPVEYIKDNYKVTGFVGNLSVVKKRRGEQFLFLNRRFIQDRLLSSTVVRAYQSLIERGEFPFFLLNLSAPLDGIDVNVHPAKLEVRFQDEWRIYHVMKSATAEALKDILATLPDFSNMNQNQFQESQNTSFNFNKAQSFSDIPTENAPRSYSFNDEGNIFQIERAQRRIEQMMQIDEKINHKVYGNIFQILNKYIVTEVKSGMLIIDQHVAHERILFESAKKALEGNGLPSQTVLFPQTLKFLPDEYNQLIDIIPYLEKIGFRMREFGDNMIIIDGIPSDVYWGGESGIIREILDKYIGYNELNASFMDYIAATYSCKAAIKAGEKLESEEMKNLVDKLFATEHPYYCPHGRPIIVNLSLDELDKRFERK
jgi:DNA mismatch repair protein MutL